MQDVASLLKGLVEPDERVEDRFVLVIGLVDVLLAREDLAVLIPRAAAEGEAIQVVVPPAEGGLDRLVHDVQVKVGSQLEPAPDHGIGVVQIHSHPEDPPVAERWPAKLRPGQPFTPNRQHLRQSAQVVEIEAGDECIEASLHIGIGVVWHHNAGDASTSSPAPPEAGWSYRRSSAVA